MANRANAKHNGAAKAEPGGYRRNLGASSKRKRRARSLQGADFSRAVEDRQTGGGHPGASRCVCGDMYFRLNDWPSISFKIFGALI